MNEGIIERLEMVLSDMGLTRNAFSKSVGLDGGTIAHLLGRRIDGFRL